MYARVGPAGQARAARVVGNFSISGQSLCRFGVYSHRVSRLIYRPFFAVVVFVLRLLTCSFPSRCAALHPRTPSCIQLGLLFRLGVLHSTPTWHVWNCMACACATQLCKVCYCACQTCIAARLAATSSLNRHSAALTRGTLPRCAQMCAANRHAVAQGRVLDELEQLARVLPRECHSLAVSAG